MTGLEIAKYTGKRHDHVFFRDIKTMLGVLEKDAPSFGDISTDTLIDTASRKSHPDRCASDRLSP